MSMRGQQLNAVNIRSENSPWCSTRQLIVMVAETGRRATTVRIFHVTNIRQLWRCQIFKFKFVESLCRNPPQARGLKAAH
eukprot:scaffold174867_cov29-Prasinocladus_malaysianus.AAC.1